MSLDADPEEEGRAILGYLGTRDLECLEKGGGSVLEAREGEDVSFTFGQRRLALDPSSEAYMISSSKLVSSSARKNLASIIRLVLVRKV